MAMMNGGNRTRLSETGLGPEVTVSPAVARSRARCGGAVGAFLILSPLLAWLLATVGWAPPGAMVICGLVGGPLGFLLVSGQCEEIRLIKCSMSTVTARTFTGERTVDLRRIRSVRLHVGFSYGRTFHTLVVRDEEGVRLGFTTVRSRRALKRAIQRIPAGTDGAPNVGAAARAVLDLAPRGYLWAHTVIAFLSVCVVITLYVAAVIRIAGG